MVGKRIISIQRLSDCVSIGSRTDHAARMICRVARAELPCAQAQRPAHSQP
jgi:hypothetical protein